METWSKMMGNRDGWAHPGAKCPPDTKLSICAVTHVSMAPQNRHWTQGRAFAGNWGAQSRKLVWDTNCTGNTRLPSAQEMPLTGPGFPRAMLPSSDTDRMHPTRIWTDLFRTARERRFSISASEMGTRLLLRPKRRASFVPRTLRWL